MSKLPEVFQEIIKNDALLKEVESVKVIEFKSHSDLLKRRDRLTELRHRKKQLIAGAENHIKRQRKGD